MKAIIGGTGVYASKGDSIERTLATKYGEVTVDIVKINGEEIVFLPRHGKNHSVPPHLINYRANIMALKELGVKHIYSTAAVGSSNDNFHIGDIVVIKDFLDFTKSRPSTFFEGGHEPVKHVDMSDPYCKNMRSKFYEFAEKHKLDIKGEAIYVSTEGPRFESAAEIRMYMKLGGDVVGMTSVPEVVLAKEMGICYSTIGIITNYCTGLSGEISFHDIEGAVNKNKEKIREIFIDIFQNGLDQENCTCKDSIIEL